MVVLPHSMAYPPLWATAGRAVNMHLLLMFQKQSSSAVADNNNNGTSHRQTVDLATAKLNDLYDAGNDPLLDGPEKFRSSSQSHMHDNTSNSGSTAVNNAQLNAARMNTSNMNMLGMANFSARLLTAQITASRSGFGQPGLAGLGGFVRMQGGDMQWWSWAWGPGRSGGRPTGLSASGSSSSAVGNNGTGEKKYEEDFDPAVLNDIVGWLSSLS